MAKITPWPKDAATGQYTKPVPPLPAFNVPLVDKNGVMTPAWIEYFFKQRVFLEFIRSNAIETTEKANTVIPP